MITLPIRSIDAHSQDLQQRVALYLEKQHLAVGGRLRIEAHGGVVTLSGRVPTFYQRQLIYSSARRVAGVIQVVDQLEVETPVAPARRAGFTVLA